MISLCLLAMSSVEGASGKVFPVASKHQAAYARAVQYVMSLGEEEMLALVPEQSGIYFTECPNCDTDAQDRAQWEWDPRKPKELRCPGCGAVYPNAKYPDNKFLSVEAPNGEHRYPYYERKDGYRVFFQAAADYKAADYMAETARKLAELYWISKDETFARRSALILLRFAELYPGYAHKFDYPFRQKVFVPYTQNRVKGMSTYRTSKWSWWAYMGISHELLTVFDAVRFWDGLDQVSDGKARATIEGDLFGEMVSFVMGFKETYSNMSPGMWRDFIYAGRVLGRPDWIAEGVTRTNRFLETRFLYDGHWQEPAPSYCGQVLGAVTSVLASVQGYEPLPASGGVAKSSSGDETRGLGGVNMGETLRLSKEKMLATIATLRRSYYGIRLPNGGLPPINDTWSRSRLGKRNSSASLLMPGLGLAILAGGEGQQQICAWLNNTGGRGHKHYDALSMGMFAHNRELLRDIGYTHTAWRAWTLCTMSHNTVVVDGVNSGVASGRVRNRLRCFVSDGQGFHLSEAENDAVYPGKVTRFRRTLALVGSDSRDAYLIDLFQVSGGKQHDYLLHGSADEESTAQVSGVDLQPVTSGLLNSGVKFKYPKGESSGVGHAGGYGFVRKLAAGSAAGDVILDLRLTSSPEVGTRSYLAGVPGTEIYRGDAPRIREAERHDGRLPEFQAPFFCARRKGEGLSSVFVAVHEPVNGETKIDKVIVDTLGQGILITVERGPLGRDYFAMALDEPVSAAHGTADGVFQFDGSWGLVRTTKGVCREVHLVAGKRIGVGDFLLKGEPGWDGEIREAVREVGEATRGYVVVAEQIPSDTAATTLLLTFPDGMVRGYTVGRIESIEDGSRIHVVEDPGFVLTDAGVQLTIHPQRVIEGREIRYQLHAATHFRASELGE